MYATPSVGSHAMWLRRDHAMKRCSDYSLMELGWSATVREPGTHDNMKDMRLHMYTLRLLQRIQCRCVFLEVRTSVSVGVLVSGAMQVQTK